MFGNMFSRPVRSTSSMSLDGSSEMPKKGKEGSCDENPIVIPQLQSQPFRNFLLAVYGRYVHPELFLKDYTQSMPALVIKNSGLSSRVLLNWKAFRQSQLSSRLLI